MISNTIKFHSKKIENSCISGESCLALNFKWNALTAEISLQHTHFFNWLASFHIFHSCTILVYSIGHTGFLLHFGRFWHCNLGEFVWRIQVQTGSWGFYFLCCSILQRSFLNFLTVLQKVFVVYVFPYFVLV